MQGVPYSILAPGQVDVNIAYPIDVSGKRRTRIKSAGCILRSVEWKFRDFDRRQVDNIQTLFVDTLASQVTVEFMQKSYQTAEKELKEAIRLGKPELDRYRAENDLRDAEQALDDVKSQLRDQRMALGLFLSISDPDSIRLQGWLYDGRTYPDPEDHPEDARAILEGLTRLAFEHRPDLQSQRWNLCRALADVEAVRASRLDDVSFLLQPYTYSPMLPDRTGWAVGVTIPLPIYNRQQGNLAKAQQIVWQTRAQLTSLENTVRAEVAAAYNAVVDTWGDMDRYYTLRSNPREPADLDRQDPTMSNNVRDYLVKLDPIVRSCARHDQP